MEESLYSPGELIFKENEIDDFSLYYLVKGQVLILTKNSLEEETQIKKITKRQYFGEISFITGNKRTATAKAREFCRVYKIKREEFIKIIKNNEQDFENFQMIKEAICIKKNLKFAYIRCYLCN